MIIKKDSVLYNLPTGLALKDLLILDSIRFTAELIEYNYSLFFKELENISHKYENNKAEFKKDLIPVFNSCWSIIDNCQRLIKQYKLLPSDNKHSLITKLAYITPLRNTFQHMDERIEECLIEFEMPFYGVISWEVNLNDDEMTQKFFLISGLYIPRGKLDLKIEKKINPLNEIVDIKLETFIRKGRKPNFKYKKVEVNISDLYQQIKSIIMKFEDKLNIQFMEQNAINADWIKSRDVLIKVNY